jgi:hypothetical protein
MLGLASPRCYYFCPPAAVARLSLRHTRVLSRISLRGFATAQRGKEGNCGLIASSFKAVDISGISAEVVGRRFRLRQ